MRKLIFLGLLVGLLAACKPTPEVFEATVVVFVQDNSPTETPSATPTFTPQATRTPTPPVPQPRKSHKTPHWRPC